MSIGSYVTSLRELAKTCSLETCTDNQMIQDQIVLGLLKVLFVNPKCLEIVSACVNREKVHSKPQPKEHACYRCGS